MNRVPTFETDRLILRGLRVEDAEAYARYFVDWAVISQLAATVPWPYPAAGVRDFLARSLEDDRRWLWGLYLKTKPDELIGAIDVGRIGRENRGFWLGRPFWGRGLMTEACDPVTDYAFDHLGFDELVFSNARGNVGSRRVKEKAGARFLGLREARFVDPNYTHAETWVLTRDDWRLARGTETQRRALAALREARVFETLADFKPVLAGTVPLDIDVGGSDLDVICEARDLSAFARVVERAWPTSVREVREVRGVTTFIARFPTGGFDIEIFAQDTPVADQYAVLHLRVEGRLLAIGGDEARRAIRALKGTGMKTEPAFASHFGLDGDPYDTLATLSKLGDEELKRALGPRH